MKKLIFILSFVPIFFLHAEEPYYRITFGGNFKNIPLETYSTNKISKKTLGLKFDNWVISPSTSNFITQENNSIFSKPNKVKDIFFIRFKAKF
jgi:hypothetical protein